MSIIGKGPPVKTTPGGWKLSPAAQKLSLNNDPAEFIKDPKQLQLAYEILSDLRTIRNDTASGIGTPVIAGGWVRDAMIGIAPKDLDLWAFRSGGRNATTEIVDVMMAFGWPKPEVTYALNPAGFPGWGNKGPILENSIDHPNTMIQSIREIVKFKLPSMDVDLVVLKPVASSLIGYFDLRAAQADLRLGVSKSDHKLRLAMHEKTYLDIQERRLFFWECNSRPKVHERADKIMCRLSEATQQPWSVELEAGR